MSGGSKQQRKRRQREAVAARSAAVRDRSGDGGGVGDGGGGGAGGGAGDGGGAGAGGVRLAGPVARLRVPGAKPVVDVLLASTDSLLGCRSALDAELWLVGAWASILAGAPPDSDFDLFLADVVDEARRCGTPGAWALLRVMSVVGPPQGAQQAALALAGAGPEVGDAGPAWSVELGAVTPLGCRFVSDPFRERVHLVCRFGYPGGVGLHTLVVTIDTAFAGVATGIELVEGRFAESVTVWRLARACGGRRAHLVDLSVEQALRLLEAALAATVHQEALGMPDLASVEELDADGRALLPLLLQRVRAMTTAVGRAPAQIVDGDPLRTRAAMAAAWPEERRSQLVEAFMRDRAEALRDVPAAAMLAARLVDRSVDVLFWAPDRIGPRSVVRMMTEVVPGSLLVPEEVLSDLERVVPEWFTWVLERSDVLARDRASVLRAIQESAVVLARRARDRRVRPEFPYVADLSRGQAGGDELFAVLQRRGFAVPLPGKRGDGLVQVPSAAAGLRPGDTHVDDLDAARVEHRSLITAIEQGRFGVSETEFPSRVGVVNQLWDGDLPQVWDAAVRLSGSGLSRQRVLERLGRVWRKHGPPERAGLEAGRLVEGPQREAYLSALARLGR